MRNTSLYLYDQGTMTMTEKQHEKLQVCENNDEKNRVSENNRQATNGGAD